jgi:hypothetical protein
MAYNFKRENTYIIYISVRTLDRSACGEYVRTPCRAMRGSRNLLQLLYLALAASNKSTVRAQSLALHYPEVMHGCCIMHACMHAWIRT